jgi:hypothetical protein
MTVVVVGLLLASSTLQAPSSAPGAIQGRVVAEGSNTPIAGARVMLMPAALSRGPFGPPAQTTTDQDGAFAFVQVAAGEYRLDVQKAGFVPYGYVPPGSRPPASRTIQVEAGQSTAIELRLQKGGVIPGRVLDVNGEPLADAQVMALRTVSTGAMSPRLMPAPGQGQQTNDLGEFRIAGLPPGEYFIAAMPRRSMPVPFGGPGGDPTPASPARTTTATTYYPGTIDPAAAQSIAVAAGETVNNVQFTMQTSPAFRVSGIVVDENGQPVAGAMVMLMGDLRYGAPPGPAGNARAGDDGRFVIGEVTPGTYRISASVPMVMNGGSGYMSFSTRAGSMSPTAGVTVTEADVAGVTVVVTRPQ